jgi:cystathionine beta-lyase
MRYTVCRADRSVPEIRMHPSTRLIRLGRAHDRRDDPHAALALPMYQAATYEQSSATGFDRYDYGRTQNPTREVLETMLAGLEDATHALAYVSGMSALSAITRLIPAGQSIAVGAGLYAGTVRLLSDIVQPQGIGVVRFDPCDPSSQAAACERGTGMVLIESPTNPMMAICDIRSIVSLCRSRGILSAVDASMMSPLRLRPLELGADLAINSATKFLGGHSDVTGGVVATNDSVLASRLRHQQNAEGTALAPFDAWLLVRGLKTLPLRLDRAESSASRVALWLSNQKEVTRVHSLALESHPGLEVHRSQASGPGAVLSFETGRPEFSQAVVEHTALFTIAVSFGSVHSQITLPNAMSHASVPERVRSEHEIPPDLVRVSVGIEHPDDLIADLDQAFEHARMQIAGS